MQLKKQVKENSQNSGKIKEIKKLGSEIKEIKKEKREDLEEEIQEEDEERFETFVSRRTSKSNPSLEQSEIINETPRERRVSKEDESEVNFRPSYTGGGNPYSADKYTPVGSAEASTSNVGIRELGERSLEQRRELGTTAQSNDQWHNSGRPESSGERGYISQQEQDTSERKKRNTL